MKPAILAGRLSPLLPALQCPRCGGAFSLTDQSLICENGHCYDLSRRGYVNLAPSHRQSGDKYDETLFESRGRVFAAGSTHPYGMRCAPRLRTVPAPSRWWMRDAERGTMPAPYRRAFPKHR